MILSPFHIKQILNASRRRLPEAEVSLDLGITKNKVSLDKNNATFPDGQKIRLDLLEKALKHENTCFMVKEHSLLKVHFFSEDTNKFYKLVPTADAPTAEMSGIRMHATKTMTPMEDTQKKLEAIDGVSGNVLDTCMGLGYTAIESSKKADIVFTCEKDRNMYDLAKLNPWSRELFNNKKISIINASSFEQIKNFKPSMFDVVIHDPPRLSLAAELYSPEFYREVFRVLRKEGKFYHYTGSPGSKNRGMDLPQSTSIKLKNAGFKDVKPAHYGVCAKK
jgi:uncharacterized protein